MDYKLKIPEDIAIRVDHRSMLETVVSMFQFYEMSEPDARCSAEVLIYADLRGIDSHGVSNMMPVYLHWLKEGFINPTAEMTVVRDTPAIAMVDGDRGMGLTIGVDAMNLALDKAEACGIGSVVVNNSRHFGAAAYYAAMALERDMIGVAMTIGGVMMVPTFGSKAILGVNPIALAAPARNEAPFIFDASTSSVAVNRIRMAKRLGATIPAGWITDESGTPIMEDAQVPKKFLMAPVGGTREAGSHKGYGISVMIDILSGLLGGHSPAYMREPGDVSHHFLAYRIDAFTDTDTFKDELDVYLKSLRECPPAPGHDRVYYAGLPEHEAEADRRANGIPYHPAVLDWYRKTTAELGIEHPLG